MDLRDLGVDDGFFGHLYLLSLCRICYDALQVRVNTARRKNGPAKIVRGPILEHIMAKVCARLLFFFTYTSTTFSVRSLDGDGLRIVWEDI